MLCGCDSVAASAAGWVLGLSMNMGTALQTSMQGYALLLSSAQMHLHLHLLVQ